MGLSASRAAAALIDFDSDVGHVIVAESASLRRDERAADIAAVHARLQRRAGHAHVRRLTPRTEFMGALLVFRRARRVGAARRAPALRRAAAAAVGRIDGRAAVEAAGPSVLAAADAGGAAGARRALDELLQAGQSRRERARPLARA